MARKSLGEAVTANELCLRWRPGPPQRFQIKWALSKPLLYLNHNPITSQHSTQIRSFNFTFVYVQWLCCQGNSGSNTPGSEAQLGKEEEGKETNPCRSWVASGRRIPLWWCQWYSRVCWGLCHYFGGSLPEVWSSAPPDVSASPRRTPARSGSAACRSRAALCWLAVAWGQVLVCLPCWGLSDMTSQFHSLSV